MHRIVASTAIWRLQLRVECDWSEPIFDRSVIFNNYQNLDQLLNKLNFELDAKDKTIIDLKMQLAAAEKTNNEYGEMISTIDANLMRAKSEGGIFKNELYKVRTHASLVVTPLHVHWWKSLELSEWWLNKLKIQTRGEIKPLKEVNIRLKVTNQNLTKTLSTLQSQHKR